MRRNLDEKKNWLLILYLYISVLLLLRNLFTLTKDTVGIQQLGNKSILMTSNQSTNLTYG